MKSDKFFKERNWLFIDFPELISNCKEAQEQVKFERDFQDKLKLNNNKLDDVINVDRNEQLKNENINLDVKDAEELKILELGCGTGSTIRSILKSNTNPKTFVYCCDFSPSAIDILKVFFNFAILRSGLNLLAISKRRQNSILKHFSLFTNN